MVRLPRPARPGSVRPSPIALLSLDPIDDYLARLEIAEVIATYLTGRQQQVAFYIFVEGWS
jgi:hypothetical protein